MATTTTIDSFGGYTDSDTNIDVDNGFAATVGEVWFNESGEKFIVYSVTGSTWKIVRGLFDNAAAMVHNETLTKLDPDVVNTDDFETDSSSDYLFDLGLATGQITINDSADGVMKHIRAAGGQNGQMAWNLTQQSEDWEILQSKVLVSDENGTADFMLAFSADDPAAGYAGDPNAANGFDNGYWWKKAVAQSFGSLHKVVGGSTGQLAAAASGSNSGFMDAQIFLVKTASAIKIFLLRDSNLKVSYTDSNANRHTGAMYAGFGGLVTTGTSIEYSERTVNQWGGSGEEGGGDGDLTRDRTSDRTRDLAAA